LKDHQVLREEASFDGENDSPKILIDGIGRAAVSAEKHQEGEGQHQHPARPIATASRGYCRPSQLLGVIIAFYLHLISFPVEVSQSSGKASSILDDDGCLPAVNRWRLPGDFQETL